MATYDHTQRGYFHWLLYFVAVLCVIAGVVASVGRATRNEPAVLVICVCIAVVALECVLAASFHYLRIRDAGDRLLLRFGPLPLLRGSVEYKSIATVEADRSSIIDGWGIHWLPGRGWTYNIWGFDCVLVTLDDGTTMRIGSDDAENLLEFLKVKMRRADIAIG
jgi:hypothetical protein